MVSLSITTVNDKPPTEKIIEARRAIYLPYRALVPETTLTRLGFICSYCVTLSYITLSVIALFYVTLIFVTLSCVTLSCVTLIYALLSYVTLYNAIFICQAIMSRLRWFDQVRRMHELAIGSELSYNSLIISTVLVML